MKLGDAIEQNPIVHTIGKATGCIDPETNTLRPESRCAKTRDWLNNIGDVIYDELFQPKRKE